MKVLSVGNSFSEDAHRYLHTVASLHGEEIETFNLYIGGCSLERHWENYLNEAEEYDLEINGEDPSRKISINEALTMTDFDVITLQQVSGLSGIYDSYHPYLKNLSDVIRKSQPKAKLMFHRTWSYEIDSAHGDFVLYNNDQKQMYDRLCEASEKASELICADIIPTGTVIQMLRETVPEFDYRNGGISLCRDGFHLSLDLGRFTAACVWFRTLTGNKVNIESFEKLDKSLVRKITDTINNPALM
ncbi:MAG: DUF4886 domain-containing protein [Clostridia bacterium]|nr:DUF4886 domain-containing protein [Clostridia bacterium]